jgi:AraC-like DNA-binding protein
VVRGFVNRRVVRGFVNPPRGARLCEMAKSLLMPSSGEVFRLNPARWATLAAECHYDCKELAALFQITSRHLSRKFAEELGTAPQDWLDLQRVIAARHMLVEAESIKEVGLSLGFRYPANFHRHFKKYVGVGPLRFLELKKQQNVLNS